MTPLSRPHPHLDPRHPRDGTAPRTNPPVFAWKPEHTDEPVNLTVALDPALEDIVLRLDDHTDPVFLPETAFAPGIYYWTWSGKFHKAEVYSFEITNDAVTVEVPSVEEWLRRLPHDHPRIYTRSEQIPELRDARHGQKAHLWKKLKKDANGVLAEPHEIDEPPILPNREEDYQAWFKIWYHIMWGTRGFVKGAATLALAYLAGGDTVYARAACTRMASVARWDPEGSSYLGRNDEAHMSVIWHGPSACDWVWDHFTDEERSRVIEQYRQRGRITFEHMRNRGYYGITRFDSHAGREIVFLANIAFVFHDHIPDATEWLTWLRPILCGVWPIWAGDDGGWAEGLSYSTAYVEIMTMFATTLKHNVHIDLYRRPFWQNYTSWRRYCLPPYAEWMGFGDHSERWGYTWLNNANLVELVDRETGTNALRDYVTDFRREAETIFSPSERGAPGVSAQIYLTPEIEADTHSPRQDNPILRIFPDVGWAAIRTDLDDPGQDIAFIFRSSPYGSVSHSHANNNDFILHVGGKVMAMPSGYYAGYGSDHHAHWVWHTKSHNCATLSDASQLMRSHQSRGMVDNVYEDDHTIYFRGFADPSYQDRAERYRRHVCFLKTHQCFLMVDEFVAREDVSSALQWNIHSWNRFDIDDEQKRFTIRREDSILEGYILHHLNGYFVASEGWEPPPTSAKENQEWRQQYHLRYTPSGLEPCRNLGVLLCPGHRALASAAVCSEHVYATEVARIGDDLILVNQSDRIQFEDIDTDALAVLVLHGTRYHIDDAGMHLS